MFSKRVFEADFRTALNEELDRNHMTIKELAERADIPVSTLYKLSLGERDARISTVKKINSIFEPRSNPFIAVIGAKFLLDTIDTRSGDAYGRTIEIRGYSANSLDECIIAAVRAEKEGAKGVVCAPVLASIIEKIVNIPVAMMRPPSSCVNDAIQMITRRITAIPEGSG